MSDVTVYQPKQRSPMIIKNLCPGLMEMGKIKIGNKGAIRQSQGGGTWQAPQKLDHFLITTMERGKDNNFLLDDSLHRLFGEAPKSIPVRLIYDDIALNFATRYICYYGKTVFCSGDGECASRLQKDGTVKQISCPCGRQDPKYTGDDGPNGPEGLGGKNSKGKCKINGILSVIIEGASVVGGVWKFRTTSYNSVVGILSSLAMIQRITGGRLAGIPMNMTVTPKTVQDPVQGSQQTIYVVGLQYAGTIDSLRNTGYEIAMTEAKHGISMKRIEEDAMLMLSHTPKAGLGDDLDQDVVEEFYPEEAQDISAPALVSPVMKHEKQTADDVEKPETEAPALVSPIQDADMVDTATGEISETLTPPTPTPAPEPAKVTRRNRSAPEAVQQPRAAAAPTNSVDDDNFPDPPRSVQPHQEDPPHPAGDHPAETQAAETQAADTTDDGQMGDLF